MNSLYGPRAAIEKISCGVPLVDVIVLATLWVSSALVMTGAAVCDGGRFIQIGWG